MFKSIIIALSLVPLTGVASTPQKLTVSVNYWRLGEATCSRTFEINANEETLFCEGESSGHKTLIKGIIEVKNSNQLYIYTIAQEMTTDGQLQEVTRMRLVTLDGKLTQSAQYDANGEIIQLAVRAYIQE